MLDKYQLLLERYKVIASYPTSPFRIGDILIEVIVDGYSKNPFFKEGTHGHPNAPSIESPEDYPHILQRLEWYQDRNINDFPTYVRDTSDDEIFQVLINIETNEHGNMPSIIIKNVEGYSVHRSFTFLKPAEENDYNKYKKKFYKK